jgi:hypothetical protein
MLVVMTKFGMLGHKNHQTYTRYFRQRTEHSRWAYARAPKAQPPLAASIPCSSTRLTRIANFKDQIKHSVSALPESHTHTHPLDLWRERGVLFLLLREVTALTRRIRVSTHICLFLSFPQFCASYSTVGR